MNRVDLVGRTTSDIELKQNVNNKNYCRFTLAVNRDFKREDGQQEADFISCVAWGKTAEVMSKYVKKGNRVAISGRIQTGKYDDESGKTIYTTDIVVTNMEFIETKKDSRPEPEDIYQNESTSDSSPTYDITSDDLPF